MRWQNITRRVFTAHAPPALEPLERRLLMAAGDPDPAFGTNGVARISLPAAGNTGFFVVDAAVQSDGKVVALLSDASTGTETLARFTAAGAADTSFSGDGLAAPFAPLFEATAVGLQSDGKIVVGGSDSGAAQAVRFLADGTPDGTFAGGSDLATFDDPQIAYFVTSLVIRPDDSIVLGGDLSDPNGSTGEDFALFALTADGDIDTAFGGGDGIASTDFGNGNGPDDGVAGLALFDDGRIVASGSSFVSASETETLAVALFNPTGTLDPSFSGDGRLTLPRLSTGAADAVAAPGGDTIALFIPAFSASEVAVLRLDAAGAPDTTFSGDGFAPIAASAAGQDGALAADPAGRLVVAFDVSTASGGSSFSTGIQLARLNVDGSEDTSFNGTAFTDSITQSNTRRVRVGADGKITAAADAPTGLTSGEDVVLVRASGSVGPTPALAGAPVATAGAATFSVTVTYTGAGRAVAPSSIGITDVRVTGPNNYSQTATGVGGVTVVGNALTATYAFPAPGGALDPADNGTYTLVVEPGEVTDAAGEPSAAGAVDTFDLAVGAQFADLSFSDTTFTAGAYDADDPIPTHFVVTASGGASAVGPFQVDVVLSVDQTFGNADDFPLTTVAAAVAGTPITSVGPIPAGTLPGDYFLIARLDDPNVIAESDETNNTFVSATAAITVANPTPTPTTAPRTIGGLDPTFGTGGVIRPRLGFTGSAGVRRLPNGKILIAGFGGPINGRDVGLARLNADTTRDLTFGAADGTDDGVAFADVRGTNDRVADFDVLPDGRIVVAGTTADGAAGIEAGSDWFVARFNTDGTLDATFGGGNGAKPGVTLIDFSANVANRNNDIARDLLVLPDGRLVVVGRTNSGGAAGGAGTDFAVARLTANGAPDGSFGAAGRAVVDFGSGDDGAQGVIAAPDGGLVVAGYGTQAGARRIALAKFTAAGVLDAKFGTGGLVVTTAGGTRERANAVALGLKGQIVVAGDSAGGSATAGTFASDFVVARYSSKGKIDTKFGARGIARASFGQPASATRVSVLPDGRVTASGVTSADVARGQADRFDLAVARFSAKGTPDPSFGNGTGKAVFSTAPPPSGTSTIRPLAVAPAAALQPAADSPGETTTPDDNVDEFENSSEGKLSDPQGGGALIAGTSDDATVVATVVTTGVDLSGEFVTKVPVSVLGGAKGAATVNVANLGDVTASGTMEVRFFASTDQAFSAGDRQILALPGQKLNLKPLTLGGKPKALKAKFSFPTDLPDGNFFVLAQLNATGTVAELDPNNNTAFSNTAVGIAAPFVDLTGQPLPGGGTFVAGGKPTTVSVTLTNAGNVPLKATTGLAISLSTDNTSDAGDAVLPPIPLKLSLKANSSKATKLKVAVPAGFVPPGSYFVFGRIDPGNVVPEKNEANNLLASNLPIVVS